MRHAAPTALDMLNERARLSGWWLELAAQPTRRDTQPGQLTRLQIRSREQPDRVQFVQLAGRDTNVQAAAAALHRALLTEESAA